MQCSACGKTGFVIISGQRFCSNCGAKMPGAGGPTTSMSDIKSSGQPLDLRPKQDETAAVDPAPAPVRPAASFHGATAGKVLDLRGKAPASPQPAPATAPPPVEPQPTPAVAAAPQPAPQPKPQPAPEPPKPAPAPVAAISAPAPVQAKPPVISSIATAKQPTFSTPAAAAPTPPAATNRSPLVKKFAPEPSSLPALPSEVATKVEAMGATAAKTSTTVNSPDLQQALTAAKAASAPSFTKVAAAVAAVAVMSGVVWLQNSPKLAFHNAASKAGIEASLPTYIPSSYHQAGPATVGDGQLTLQFSSPSADQPLKITQKSSNWDSDSLRQNYISKQTTDFLAVQGQGLTIYVFGDQANWVNHGVWYQISGTAKLSREQILKIAYGL